LDLKVLDAEWKRDWTAHDDFRKILFFSLTFARAATILTLLEGALCRSP
jgi:hypothetical protein